MTESSSSGFVAVNGTQEPPQRKTLSREEFLERRRHGIGGSDIAAIIGLSPWKSPRDVWFDKVGHDGEGNHVEPEPETPAMYWGNVHEQVVADEYERRTGRKVEIIEEQFTAEGQPNGGRPYFIANLDRLVRVAPGVPAIGANPAAGPGSGPKLNTDRLLECKTSSQYASGDWGEEGTDDIPECYRCQVQWYLGVTGCRYADVAVLIGGNDYRIYTVERSDEAIAFLFEQGEAFWRDYVEADVMPPARSASDSVRAFSKGSAGEKRFASDDVAAKCREYAAVNAQVKELERVLDGLKRDICEEMGEAVELLDKGGGKLCSWSASKPSSSVDYKGLVAHLAPPPEVVRQFTTEKPTARRFTIAKIKD